MSRGLTLLFVVLLAFGSGLQAQQTYLEDFQSGWPAGYEVYDVDGRVHDGTLAWIAALDTGWDLRESFDNAGDSVAVSTSWYDPTGQADDWMITTLLSIDSFTQLSWNAQAPDDQFPDGYEVRISTASKSITDFMANPPLLTVAAEEDPERSRTVDLRAAGYMNQSVYLAFRNNSNNQFVLFIDDIALFNPFGRDIQVTDLDLPDNSCTLGSSETIEVEFTNQGFSDVDTVEVTYVVDSAGVTIQTVTELYTTTISQYDTVTYTFTTGANISTAGTAYGISAYVNVWGDADLSNDTIGPDTVYNVMSSTVPYLNTFETFNELLGLSFDNVGGDLGWVALTGGAFSGTNTRGYLALGNSVANDWMFSTCIDMNMNTGYVLSYYYTTGNLLGNPATSEDLEVYIGTAPTVAAMTTQLGSFNYTNTTYEQEEINYTVPANGTYYIGFRARSDANTADPLIIDDLAVDLMVPPVASFTVDTNQLGAEFMNTSTNNPDTYTWDFGDGSPTSNMASPSHNYAAPGIYTVCLIVSNFAGADTTCMDVGVTVTPPTADFSYLVVNDGLTVNFTNMSTPASNIDSFYWDFGDATSSNALNPSHTYTSATTYQVCLSAFNIGGGDTECKTITGVSIGDELKNGSVSIFPNPTSDIISVNVTLESAADVEVSIYDLAGKRVGVEAYESVTDKKINFDLSSQPAGVYLINLNINGLTTTQKIILDK